MVLVNGNQSVIVSQEVSTTTSAETSPDIKTKLTVTTSPPEPQVRTTGWYLFGIVLIPVTIIMKRKIK